MNRAELEECMRIALGEAQKAFEEDEVPVGAAVFRGDLLLASDHNRSVRRNDLTAHAELLALQAAARRNGGRLDGCTLFVTLEPCAMCFGAAKNLRVEYIVFGAYEPVSGACASCCDLSAIGLGKTEVIGGILASESRDLLSAFFSKKRSVQREETGILPAEEKEQPGECDIMPPMGEGF